MMSKSKKSNDAKTYVMKYVKMSKGTSWRQNVSHNIKKYGKYVMI